MPDAYRALDTVRLLTNSAPADSARVSGTHSRPSPAPGVDARDELYQTIRSWEDDIRGFLRHRAARDLNTHEDTLESAVRYLNRNWDRAIARDPGGKDFGLEMLGLFSRALRMVKNGPIRSRLTIPCPRCSSKALVQQEGIAGRAWYTLCSERIGGCGVYYTEVEMEWAAHVRLAVR